MVRLRNRPGGNIISLAAEIYGTDDVSRLLRLIGANMPVSVPFDPMPVLKSQKPHKYAKSQINDNSLYINM